MTASPFSQTGKIDLYRLTVNLTVVALCPWQSKRERLKSLSPLSGSRSYVITSIDAPTKSKFIDCFPTKKPN